MSKLPKSNGITSTGLVKSTGVDRTGLVRGGHGRWHCEAPCKFRTNHHSEFARHQRGHKER